MAKREFSTLLSLIVHIGLFSALCGVRLVCFPLSGLAVLDLIQALILSCEKPKNLLHRIGTFPPSPMMLSLPDIVVDWYLFQKCSPMPWPHRGLARLPARCRSSQSLRHSLLGGRLQLGTYLFCHLDTYPFCHLDTYLFCQLDTYPLSAVNCPLSSRQRPIFTVNSFTHDHRNHTSMFIQPQPAGSALAAEHRTLNTWGT